MTDDERVAELERRLQETVGDPRLALTSLTHKSYVNEVGAGEAVDNERLEFLGDAVIDLAISHRLMERFPTLREGDLSKVRAAVVNEAGLARVARDLALGDLLLLGRGEERTGGREKESVLANTLEAVVAALYLDKGMDGIFRFVDRFFARAFEAATDGTLDRDYKTRVQELAQCALKLGPRYRVVDQSGPDHERIYTVELIIGEVAYARGSGRSKKDAEQAAAREALPLVEAVVAAPPHG